MTMTTICQETRICRNAISEHPILPIAPDREVASPEVLRHVLIGMVRTNPDLLLEERYQRQLGGLLPEVVLSGHAPERHELPSLLRPQAI